jgi:hypothetical protein
MARAFASNAGPDELRVPWAADLATKHRLPSLLLLVALQCALYGTNLKLLPMWGDETFTVVTAAEGPSRIIQLVREDIHPPLYFLLAHWWDRLPLGSDPLVRLRAMSVLFALLTTVFLDLCWLRNASPALRNWSLVLWTFSPCLLLYSRMARSYSMQMFSRGRGDLVSGAIGRRCGRMENPGGVRDRLDRASIYTLFAGNCSLGGSGFVAGYAAGARPFHLENVTAVECAPGRSLSSLGSDPRRSARPVATESGLHDDGQRFG